MKRILLILSLSLLVSGCSVFTKPTNTVTLERQEFINAWARAKVLYVKAVSIAQAACENKQWSATDCLKAAQLHEQAKQIGSEVEAKLATPESEIDGSRVMKLLELALGILL